MKLLYRASWTLALAGLVALTGCRQYTTNEGSNDGTQPSQSARIDPEEEPTAEQKQQILAAKDALFEQLSSRLKEAMISGGPVGAIQVCRQEAPKIASEVSDQENVRIGRTGVRLRNPENQPPAWAAPLVAEKVSSPQFVSLTDGRPAALLPIKLKSQCLMCHGPAEQISPAVKTELARHYPRDQATGFREGELRGWFWVVLPN